MTDLAFSGAGVDDDGQDKVRPLSVAASPLDSLREAFAKVQRQSDIIKLPHPGARHIVLHFNRHTVTDYDRLNVWRNSSQDDQQRFMVAMLTNACEDIEVDGTSTGYNLASQQLQELTGTVESAAAVKAFFNDNFLWIGALTADLVHEAAKKDDGVDPPVAATS